MSDPCYIAPRGPRTLARNIISGIVEGGGGIIIILAYCFFIVVVGVIETLGLRAIFIAGCVLTF